VFEIASCGEKQKKKAKKNFFDEGNMRKTAETLYLLRALYILRPLYINRH
jgi:hypothetical protein